MEEQQNINHNKKPLLKKSKTNQKQLLSKLSKDISILWAQYCSNENLQLSKYLPFKQKIGDKSVCAKHIQSKQTIVQCYNCRTDSSCIICMDCFKNSNHEGHKYVIKSAGGGCCDCGDIQAWKKQGFCTKHSGQVMDAQVTPNDIKQFVSIFEELFYLYFLELQNNKNFAYKFVVKLFKYLISLNTNSIYYNKLTTLLLTRILSPQRFELKDNVNSISILANILKFQNQMISHLAINLFIAMFPYYPFKQILISAYFHNYHLMFNGSQQSYSAYASSLSCQILTSHQLVDDYITTKGSIGIGQNLKILSNLEKTVQLQCAVYHDADNLSKLKNQASLHFWQFQIRRGLNSFFLCYDQTKIQIEKLTKQAQIVKMRQLIDFSRIQFILLNNFQSVMKILQKDIDTLVILIREIYSKVLKQRQQKTAIIFKPYERLLSLTLFAYFNYDLKNCLNSDYTKKLYSQVLMLSEEQYCKNNAILLKIMLKTYLFSNKIAQKSNLVSTLYGYFYFYKLKNKMFISLDIILIKILILTSRIEPIINFKEILEIQKIEPQQQSFSNLITLISDLTILYVSKIPEIYICYAINHDSKLYSLQIEEIVIKIFKQKKYILTKEDIQAITSSFFNTNINLVHNFIKNISDFNKQKKHFILKEQYKVNIGINFHDFKTSFVSSQEYQTHKKTTQLIKEYNHNLIKSIWSQSTVRKVIQLFHNFAAFMSQGPKNLKNLINQFTKLYLILKEENIEYSKLIKQMILDLTQVKKHISQFYYSELGMIEEKIINEEDQRKKKIKEIRQLKIREMKQKQHKAQSTHNSTQKAHALKINDIENLEFCCICKNDNPINFVYPAYMKMANYERTMSGNKGVQCLSFKSCYHIFDHQCLMKFTKNNYEESFKCPLCRTSANIFIPIKGNKKLVKIVMLKLIQTLVMYKQQKQLNLVEELLKSFYHYILIAFNDVEYCLKKRLNIYQKVLATLKNIITIKQIQQLISKINDNQLSSNSELTNNNKKGMQIHQQIQDLSENDFDEQQGFQILDQNNSDQEYEPHGQDLNYFIAQLKDKKIQPKPIKNEENQIFKITMIQILNYLKNQQYKCSEPTMAFNNPNQLRIFMIAINLLFGYQKDLEIGIMINQKKTMNLIQLPQKYTPLGIYNQCCNCKQISPTLLICLLCANWKGCKACKNGSASVHAEEHGNLGVYLSLDKANILIVDSLKRVSAGCLYKDQLGNPFTISKNWDNYQLDFELYNQISEQLLHDELDLQRSDK